MSGATHALEALGAAENYASADRPRVKPLVDELHRRAWSVWWDHTIRPGKSWDEVIEAALADARCVIVLWSSESIRSDRVKAEADEARRRGIWFAARLDDVMIPLAFRRFHAANLVDCSGVFAGAEFDGPIEALTELLGGAVPLVPGTMPGLVAGQARVNPTDGLTLRLYSSGYVYDGMFAGRQRMLRQREAALHRTDCPCILA